MRIVDVNQRPLLQLVQLGRELGQRRPHLGRQFLLLRGIGEVERTARVRPGVRLLGGTSGGFEGAAVVLRVGAVGRFRDEEQLATFVAAYRPSPLYPIVALAAATGMGRNEVLAVQWSDFDAETGSSGPSIFGGSEFGQPAVVSSALLWLGPTSRRRPVAGA